MIDIIIINYNCAGDLQNLLSVLTGEEKKVYSRRNLFQITVVDNHSSDGSVSMVESQFPSVHLIPRSNNDGYAAAVNEGIASTQQREILLMNSDVLITPEKVCSLVRIWERLDFPGILAPLHLEPDGFPQLTWGKYPTRHVEAERKKLEQALSQRKTWAKKEVFSQCCKTREVDWVSGSCLFFSRSTAYEIGPWDQNFFLYFEDIDWCLRAKEMGYSVYHTSETHVVHQHGASMAHDPETAELEYRRSQCYFTKKYFGTWALWQLRGYLTGKMLKRWFLGRRSGFERSTSWQILQEIWRKPGI